MENQNFDVEKLQKSVTQCVLADCPSASVCLRQIVRRRCSKSLEKVTIYNPDAIVMDGDRCQFFRSTDLLRYGRGFEGYFEQLSFPEARAARAVLTEYFHNRTQLMRYRSGYFRLDPERMEEINALLEAAGVPLPLQCDSYEYDV